MASPESCTAPSRFARRVTAEPSLIGELRRAVVAHAEAVGVSHETCEAVALAVSEALTNVVRHAYAGEQPGPIVVEARPDGEDQLLVVVCDEGSGLIPRADSPGLGLGLGLMAQMAADFSIANRHDARGTIVSLRFPLGRSPMRSPAADAIPAP